MSREFSKWFVGAGAKTLSEVEVNPGRSNQHEFQATALVRRFLGETKDKRTMTARFVYLADQTEPLVESSWVTYYDVRVRQPDRSAEFRIYYPDNEVVRCARAGDLLLIAQRADESLVVVIAASGSSIASQMLWLFEFPELPRQGFAIARPDVFRSELSPIDAEVLFAAFGIEPEVTTTDIAEAAIGRFGLTLPPTKIFSEFARSLVPDADPLNEPDETLLRWWSTEYMAFQAMERHIVASTLEEGFRGETAVDDFLTFSLSVQNRRKSRSGHAFENHIEQILVVHGVPHTRIGRTERNARPDFLFPSQSHYDDLNFATQGLFMLGAKTTAKDRWRQVLSEADRISIKHLATMEPAISTQQTDEMIALGVQLVVPASLHYSYTDSQQNWLWTIGDFIAATQSLSSGGAT